MLEWVIDKNISYMLIVCSGIQLSILPAMFIIRNETMFISVLEHPAKTKNATNVYVSMTI